MRRPTTVISLGLVALVTLLAACTQGEGSVVADTRAVGAFTRIEAGAGIHVSVTFGAAEPIVVHAQPNIQEKVSTDVSDGTLHIDASHPFTVADPVVVDVVIPALDAVSLSGGAAIEASGFAADALEVTLSDGARASIGGTVGTLTLDAQGGSTASLGDLDAGDVSVDLFGGASAAVRASGSVAGEASGGAHLTVSGDASVKVEVSGGSEVHHA